MTNGEKPKPPDLGTGVNTPPKPLDPPIVPEAKGEKLTITGVVTDVNVDPETGDPTTIHVAHQVTGGGAIGVTLDAKGVKYTPGDAYKGPCVVDKASESTLTVLVTTALGDTQPMTVDRAYVEK